MAEKRTIDINIESNADETAKDFEKVADSVEDVDSKVNGLKKSSEGSVGGLKKVSTAGKAIGTAFKAAGIGLIIAAFTKFTEVLMQNQKVADFFSTTFETLSIMFNDFINFIFDNVGGVVDSFKAFFEDPLESIKNLGTAIKNNIIERFTSAIEAIGFLGDAIVKVFQGDFTGAAESAKNAGKEFIDTLTGVDDSFDKTVETVGKVVDATTKYVKETVKAAEENVNLAKSAEIAAAQNAKIIEQKDREAELQRQIRDDETKTFEERKAASEQLAVVLDEQEKAMKANAAAIVAAAQAQLNKNANDENQIALINAQTEAEGILAQVTGLRSEQQTSDVSLKKEIVDATNAVLESEANLSIEQKRINAEAIEDDLTRLKTQQEIDAEEKKIQTERLQRVVDEAKEGTQAKIDAQIALDEFEVESERIRLERKKEIAEKEKEISDEATATEIENNAKAAESKKAALDMQLQTASSVFGSIGNLANLLAEGDEKRAKKAFLINKAVGIAQATISTAQGIMSELSDPKKVLTFTNYAAAAAMAAAGAIQIATIAKTKFQGGGGGGNVTAPTASLQTQAPNFNVVGDSGVNQLATLQQQPTMAYVVSGEVTTAQALDRNRVQNATL